MKVPLSKRTALWSCTAKLLIIILQSQNSVNMNQGAFDIDKKVFLLLRCYQENGIQKCKIQMNPVS